ncbi:MAG: transcription antitermination factor NusB [Acidimicrobiales bacterium]
MSRGEASGTPRREARERALELLYEAEAKHESPAAVLEALAAPPDPFVSVLVRGVDGQLARIDELIGRCAENWDLDRMAAVDRAILRMAAYELLDQPDIPVAVVIDEAVVLAGRFSTDESGAFVNGVLSALAREVRP